MKPKHRPCQSPILETSTPFRRTCIASALIVACGTGAYAQATRTWSGASGSAWLTTGNWSGGGIWAGNSPLANPAGEGAATDIMTTAATNGAGNIGINMNTLTAGAGGVGLILGGIDFNKTNTTNLQIGNSSTVNGVLRLNGTTINSVANTLVRVAGSANLVIANVNSGTGSQTMGLQLGITNGVFDVASGRALTINSIISELNANSGFTKTGAGVLNLGAGNTFTGAVAISGGTLVLNSPTALGGNNPGVNGTSSISMAAGTTLRSDYIIADAGNVDSFVYAPITLTGSGNANFQIGAGSSSAPAEAVTFNLNGAIGGTAGTHVVFSTSTASLNNADSTFVLGAASTYDGNTTITTGNSQNRINVKAGVTNALPTTTVLTMDSAVGNGTGRTAQFDLNGNDQTLAGLTNGGVVPNFKRQIVTNTGALSTLTINNTADFTFGGSTTATNGSGTSTVRAQITGNIALTKSGTGTFTLGGTLTGGATAGGNTFNGPTKILGGILSLGETVSLQNSPLDTAGSVTGDSANGLRATVSTLRLGGLTGSKNFADIFTTTSGGYSSLTELTFNPISSAIHSYLGDIGDGATGMNLIKVGAGTQILTGTNSHTGTTTVSSGTLLVNGSLAATSSVTVNGGILGGTGSITGPLIVNAGTLSPGASIETLASGSLSLNDGSTFAQELDSSVAATVAADLMKVSGDLSLAGTVTLTLDDLATLDTAFAEGTVFSLINYTGSWNGGKFTHDGNLLENNEIFLAGLNSWQISYVSADGGLNYDGEYFGGTDRFVNLTAVPEPRAALLGGLGLLALLRRRR